jgi:hypothetical protein
MLYSIMLRVSRTFFAEYGLAEYLRNYSHNILKLRIYVDRNGVKLVNSCLKKGIYIG